MNCWSVEQLLNYVNNTLNEKDQTELEDHLYSCDMCLAQYMAVLDEEESQLPVMTNSTNFTDVVMEGIVARKKTVVKKRPNGHSLTHYTIAAGLTLMLMFSGVFDGLTTIISDDAMNQTKSGSFSHDMLNRTVDMMELLNKNEKEGN